MKAYAPLKGCFSVIILNSLFKNEHNGSQAFRLRLCTLCKIQKVKSALCAQFKVFCFLRVVEFNSEITYNVLRVVVSTLVSFGVGTG